MAGNEMNGLISFMITMVASVDDHRVKASSISHVPEQPRKSREEANKPKVVSIGPLHRGTARRELLYMEEIKWRCMRSLLYRTPKPEESMRKCSEAIYALDEVVHTPTVWKTMGVIAAIVLLGLTIAQTIFAARSS